MLYRFPNVSITTCIFEDDCVEFYFVLEGISSIDKSLLVNEIATFLDVDASFAERIKVTQLNSKPVGERTHSAPGHLVTNVTARPATVTTLGAFVSIEGKFISVESHVDVHLKHNNFVLTQGCRDPF